MIRRSTTAAGGRPAEASRVPSQHFNYDGFGAHHLCLQLDWFPDGAGRTLGAQMWVDAVRVYAHPDSQRFRAPQGVLGGPSLYGSPVVDRFAAS